VYAEDLAYIQHAGYAGFARRAAPGLLAALRHAGVRDGLVVDLGCGAGVWLRELLRAGYAGLGIDASRALLRFARRQAPHARLRHGSVYEVALPRCDAVTAIGEVLSYVPAGGRAPDLGRLFRRVAAALRPGGLFVFDAIVAGRPLPPRGFTCGPDWAVLVEAREDQRRRRLVREITTFRRRAGGWRRRHERHEQRVAARADIEAALREAGFSVRASRRYGSFELMPRRLAFRARRPLDSGA
jgi:SAM-dependent methyltransferase